ncbi:recombinase family protein [uncultured Caulobacter sp.]|uniref:recombinase family protein n=1 Tax=uncultured Caulobacter sp. TaxID=158749 RepID=UPI00261CE626|nr:recombinase family protein [uncultured Caulobacter sp.]
MTANALPYFRFSTDEQEDGDSIERQRRVCEAFIRSRGWTLEPALIDRGKSAFKNEHLNSGQLGVFARKAERGEVSAKTVLVVEKLDRLSRRPVAEVMTWIYNLTLQGVQIAVADTNTVYDANPDLGTFLTTAINAAQSNIESQKKSERITSAKERLWRLAKTKEGKWTNLAARPPLWLSRKPSSDGWTVNQPRADLIRQIYEWSADGLGSQAICRRLNDRGEKPFGVWRHRAEAMWGISAINALLANPAVEGDFVPEKGMFLGKRITGFYPRIVDADLVARARAEKTSRTKVKDQRARNGTTNLFSGLTFCGNCGSKAFMTTHNKKGRTYRYIRCEASREGRKCENSGYFAYDPFEKVALDTFIDLALDDRFFRVDGELHELRVRKAEIEKAIADQRQARSRLVALFENGDDQIADRIRALKVEIDAQVSTLATIEQEIETATGKVGAAEHLKRVNDIRFAAESDDADVAEQARAKLASAFSAVVQGVEIEETTTGRIWTLIFKGGALAVRIDPKGQVQKVLTESLGVPLHAQLPDDQQEQIAPLIERIASRIAKGAA